MKVEVTIGDRGVALTTPDPEVEGSGEDPLTSIMSRVMGAIGPAAVASKVKPARRSLRPLGPDEIYLFVMPNCMENGCTRAAQLTIAAGHDGPTHLCFTHGVDADWGPVESSMDLVSPCMAEQVYIADKKSIGKWRSR